MHTFWNLELAKKEALKYLTRSEFKKGSSGCYNYCCKNKLLKEVTIHMPIKNNPNNYWTKQICEQEALKYNNRTDFQRHCRGGYKFAYKNNFINDITSHMIPCANNYLRYIYAFEFEDNNVYVGLTYNIIERYNGHIVKGKKTSSVYKHIEKTNSKFTFKIITENPIYYIDAQSLEHETIIDYKDKGWNILNKGKTGKGCGSLGGNIIKWTKNKCHEEALKYEYRVDFQYHCSGAYDISRKKKWLNEICSHMKIKERVIYWTKERCKEIALKYTNKKDFREYNSNVYRNSHKRGWLDEICSHMYVIRYPKGYWTKEKCQEVALKYKNKTEFNKGHSQVYAVSLVNKWLNEICSHMVSIR